ncbi:non-homologous end-joining DNA ligase [Streptomyces sp. JJ36]|uniref:non-homologous end-joining DNA ligase n=1 Tax=Streptomyces sp. JJ36 TaxID=2736645 RepID=UPI001F163045|nr:non-homologous end-joining DNA ligase [Streptomyces sp. JJ36]MCF6525762.1 non-homologous end-joining DNA ligase [Streptomyces sp. JJ36]
MTAREETVRAGRRGIPLHRPGKVLFPDDGLTKRDLAHYHRAAARVMLPHLRGRPLMMLRHPDGIDDGAVVQKHVPDHFPDWIRRAEMPKEGGTVTHVLCEDTATLVYLADQACVTPHRWLSRADRPDHPDRLVFDLDPAEGTGFADVRWTARRLRALLEEELELPTRLMTTGSKGLHVLVHLDRRAGFDAVREFAADVAGLLAARHPERLTTRQRKTERRGRVYLDVQRNGYAQTAVAPYAVRALPGGPLAVPVSHDELDDPELTPRRWTLAEPGDRLEKDPWHGLPSRGRGLRAARRRLDAVRMA